MNNKNIKTKKSMGFFRINSLWMALVAVALAVGITLIITSNSNSKTTSLKNEKIDVKTEAEAAVIHVSDAEFSSVTSSGVVLVDYWATWCYPCRMQGPIIDEIATEMGTNAKICKMDVDKNPSTSAKYNIVSIPTVMIFSDGKVVEKFVGLQQKETLVAALNKYIKK